MTTQLMRKSGDIKEDERMFHLDVYYPGGVHGTLGMFKKEPTYEETRQQVKKFLDGKFTSPKPKEEQK